jgi:rhomboid protease GluP
MAVGLNPKYSVEYTLNTLTPQQFLVLAKEAVAKLGWSSGYISHTGLIAYTNNGMLGRNSEIKIKLENGSVKLSSVSTGGEVIDWGKNKQNINELVSLVDQLKTTVDPDVLAQQYQALSATISATQEDVLNLPPATTTEKITGVFSIFKPLQGYFVTPILLNLNILIFIIMVASGVDIMNPTTESLLKWGSNFRPMTLEGQWWRLLTCNFLHIGIFHLLLNMYALLYIGVLLEPLLGRLRFLSAYLLTGLTSSIASLWWHDLTVSAGASGAIFGMYGVFLAMLTTNLIEKTARKALLTSIAVFIGYNLLNGLKGGIDNAGHIGGLIGGLLIGYAFIPGLKAPEKKKVTYATIALLSVVILVFSLVVYKTLPNDIGEYDKRMSEFTATEEKALQVYNLSDAAPKDSILLALGEHGIFYWKENIKLIEHVETLNIPVEYKVRNKLLKEYCELRIKSYELLYKAFSENTEQYKEQIETANKLVEAKIQELNDLN